MPKIKARAEAKEKTAAPPVVEKEPQAPEKEARPLSRARVNRAALPPAGNARTADLLRSRNGGPGGAVGRARATSAMQRSVGNARLGRMLGATPTALGAEGAAVPRTETAPSAVESPSMPGAAAPTPETAPPSMDVGTQAGAPRSPLERPAAASTEATPETAGTAPGTEPSAATVDTTARSPAEAVPDVGIRPSAETGTAPVAARPADVTAAPTPETAAAPARAAPSEEVADAPTAAMPETETEPPAEEADERQRAPQRAEAAPAAAGSGALAEAPTESAEETEGAAQREAPEKPATPEEAKGEEPEQAAAEAAEEEQAPEPEAAGEAESVAQDAQAAVADQAPAELGAAGPGGTGPAAGPAAAPPASEAGGTEADAGPDEETAAEETEQRMDQAAPPEEVEADAMEEMESEAPAAEEMEEPEAAAEAPAAEAATETPSAGGVSPEPSGTLPGTEATQAQAEDASPTATTPEEALAPEVGPAEEPAGVEEEEAAEEEGAAPAELTPAERQAGLASLTEGAKSGEPGGGGGGGGSAISEKSAREAPDLSGQDPAQALATAGSLPPAQLQSALGGVSGAIGRSVGEQRTALAENPPTMARPSGAPQTREGPIEGREAPSERESAPDVERTPEGEAVPVPEPEPLPPPPAPPTEAVREPTLRGTAEGELSEDDVGRMSSSLARLPTSDAGLDVGDVSTPTLALEGDADPEQAREQRSELQQSVRDTHAQGQRDLGQPMGENEIYPTVPRETLTAQIQAGGGGEGASAAGGAALEAAAGGADGNDALSIIAQQTRGEQIQAAVTQARADMAAKREEHATRVAEERASSQEEIARLEEDNASAQAEERESAQGDVESQRQDWDREQGELTEQARTEADQAVQDGEQDVSQEQRTADEESARHIQTGEEQAAEARRTGEEEAERERQRGEEQSDGFFGWLASRARAFFDGIKRGIQRAFEAARRAVRAAIDRAKELATAAIERARQAVVSVIRRVGDALIAIGDRVLAGFPALRDRFRNAIQERVARAEAAVNRLADELKEGVQNALDMLGAGLDAALGLLERGMLAAVDVVNNAVQGAIQFAQSVAQAIGAFLDLVKDVAASPGQWIRNLGAAVVDGIRNHLWRAFKEAVQNWFNQKLEEVLGLGTAIWGLLTQGGISLAQIGSMVWEALKSAIPIALVQLLIEKLVSMIVPAAGAVMAIIEGLQAAWGTVRRIIQAFQLFFAFLKAVKGGNAGPQFARALAAAAIVVIDFVANWLLRRLRRPAQRVGGRIRAIAQRIGRRVGRAARRVGRRARRAVGRFRARRRRRRAERRRRRGDDPRRRRAERERRKQQRLDRARRELSPRINRLLSKGVSRLRLRAQLTFWRARYRLKSLKLEGSGKRIRVVGRASPPVEFAGGLKVDRRRLLQIVRRVAGELYRHEKTRRGATSIREGVEGAPRTPRGSTAEPVDISGEGLPALARYLREREQPSAGTQRVFKLGEAETGDLLVREQLMPFSRGRKGTEVISRAVAAEGGGFRKIPTGRYSDIAERLKGMGSPARVGLAIRTFVQKKRIMPGFEEHAADLAGISVLMFGQEAARSEAALVTGAMVTDLMAEGVDPSEAISKFPMEPEKAVELSREVDEFAEGTKNYDDLSPKAQEMAEREIALVKEWVERRLKDHVIKDETILEGLILKEVKAFFDLHD